MEFAPSRDFSVGMELEFQLVDATSMNLVDGIVPVMALYPDNSNVRPEFIQNTVEVASDPCSGVVALESDLLPRVADLAHACESLGMRIVGAGTHPFSERLATITPSPRYDAMEALSGHLGHTLITFATHVHLGMPDGDAAVHLMGELKPYLPVLMVLSANSPFWHGYDTGFAAYRHRILAATRSYGQPPDFPDWSEFAEAMDRMIDAGVYANIDRVHWDLRPRPRFGTLEVRVMDAQATVAHALSLAAFVRALASFVQASRDDRGVRPLQNLPWWMHKDNCFMASRFGRDARLVANRDGRVVNVNDVLADLFVKIAPHADTLGERTYLDALEERVLARLGYEKQRAIYAATSSYRRVVSSLADELAGGGID